MKTPILYVEHFPTDKKRLAFDFCYAAMMGAEQLGITVKRFEDSSEVPSDPTNIIVGSVEASSQWLRTSGYHVPSAMPMDRFTEVLGRSCQVITMHEALEKVKSEPIFIKPARDVKAFTGFVARDPTMLEVFTDGYSKEVYVQPVVDIVSEYRCYLSNNRVVGMKHYNGDPFKYPNPTLIHRSIELGNEFNYHSYVLDFGVLADGSTILIEPNDAWAIGNYGLEPEQYYLFVRNRWLQMTGVRYRME